MFNYYELDIIPIILNRFKVNNLVICGFPDVKTTEFIVNYCDESDASYIAISLNESSKHEIISGTGLEVLPNLNNYDAIFINDDPNWYSMYNELKLIKANNDEFPLVFICNNIFPHKRRDSYIDPNKIPPEFINEYSDNFSHGNIKLKDDFYHAVQDNTSKNGVLTAIEDFISENNSIGIMNIKLFNGIIILYPINSISQIRLGKLNDEISKYRLDFDGLSDNFIENQLLIDYISELDISREDIDNISGFKKLLNEKSKLIKDYEDKINLQNSEINYKNSQISNVDSKLNLKDAKIKRFESKLLNKENEIKNLNVELQNVTIQLNSLKSELNEKNSTFHNKEAEFNNKLSKINSQINSLKISISQKEKIENELNNQLQIANKQLEDNIQQLSNKNNNLSKMNDQIRIKQSELNEKEKMLDLMKYQYTNQLSKLDNKEYCISCYKEELCNNQSEIQYLKKHTLTRKLFSPVAYLYLIFKSHPHELKLNFKLYRALKSSKCFDIGYYLANNEDILKSRWCKFFSPELHYICNGFIENRKFNKKYYNTNSKKELLDYVLNCP